jgi:hypothetical protein
MAKRSRVTGRPGQRSPIARGTRRPSGPGIPPTAPPLDGSGSITAPRRTSGLTGLEEARAAELEAQIVAQEREAESAQRRAKDRARSADLAASRTRDAAPLAVRASAEYAYVRRDIRRIVRVAILMLAVVAILYVLINVMRVIQV